MASRPWLLDQVRPPLSSVWALAPSREELLTEPVPVVEYVVVDELEEQVAVLVIEPWPSVDERGRLRFESPDQRSTVEADAEPLQHLLLERKSVEQLSEEQRVAFVSRPLRVGDVFCAVIDRAALAAGADSPRQWLRAPVIDVTAEARDAARAQYFAAVGPVLAADEFETLAAEFFADDESSDGRT
jgi:hypothetical protein